MNLDESWETMRGFKIPVARISNESDLGIIDLSHLKFGLNSLE